MLFSTLLSLLSLAAAYPPTPSAPHNQTGNQPMPNHQAISPNDTRTVPGDIAVTEELYNDLKFWVEYAGAVYCNYEKKPGDRVICASGTCGDIEGDGATIVDTMVGHKTGIAAFVAVDPGREAVVVAIRGTASLANILTDLNLLLWPCPAPFPRDCKVHKGFLHSWIEIQSAVLAAVSSAVSSHPGYKITATGHSLGGGVATLAAATLRAAHGPSDLYTYGSPRVGNAALVEYVESLPGGNYRVTHAADPVPMLPPTLLGYRHLSPEYWLNGDSMAPGFGPRNVIVCEGGRNFGCNGGEWEHIRVADHSYYFQQVSACEDRRGLLSMAESLGGLSVEVMVEVIKADMAQVGEGARR